MSPSSDRTVTRLQSLCPDSGRASTWAMTFRKVSGARASWWIREGDIAYRTVRASDDLRRKASPDKPLTLRDNGWHCNSGYLPCVPPHSCPPPLFGVWRGIGSLSGMYAVRRAVRKTSRRALRKGGRAVERGGLENRCGWKSTGGSNPSPSANTDFYDVLRRLKI